MRDTCHLKVLAFALVLQSLLCCTTFLDRKVSKPGNVNGDSSALSALLEDSIVSSSDIENARGARFKINVVDSVIQETNCERCQIGYSNLIDSASTLRYSDIYKFLCSCAPECEANVEFTEVSNGALFRLLQGCPEALVRVLAIYPQLFNPYLLGQISSPLKDYDIDAIRVSLKNAKGEESVKERINDRLIRVRP